MNVATRVCAWLQKQQKLANSACFLPGTKRKCLLHLFTTKKTVDLQIQTDDILKFHETYLNNNIHA